MTPLMGSSFYIFLVPNYASLEKSKLLNITLVRTQKYQQDTIAAHSMVVLSWYSVGTNQAMK